MADSVLYSVRTAKVWAWDPSAETYGTGVEIPNLQGFSVEPQHDTDELKNLGAIEETLSVLTSMDISISLGGIHWVSMAVMQGTNNSSSGGDTNINEDEGGDDLPYFALAVALPLKSGKEAHLYFPKCQLQSNVPLDISDQNQFVIPDVDIKAMRLRTAAGNTYPVRKYFEKASETALADIDTVFTIA